MTSPRTIVITGGSSGIGLAAARRFAAQGDEVVLIGRHPQRLAKAVERVREAGGRTPRSYRADFAVLDEVRALGERLNADLDRIDVLANNAGALVPLTRRTADGLDLTMQVNHLAGFLLTHLVLDLLRAGAPARVITTASLAEAWGWLDVDRPGASPLRFRSRWLAYGASKQANILFTVEAARRWGGDGIAATSFFPGLVQSRFGRTSVLFTIARVIPGLIRSTAGGADTLVWLADGEEGLMSGGYFAYRSPFPATPRSTDPDRAARLWEASLAAVGLPSTDSTSS
ncbi:NAD(P)-dependent dehydrogenase (short-subunit alcohol dehydrogenase family) [Allocatelliglobosispora scoriae]|uniref:NAD(P)-dependent dehydrogenase (Short-subunit alcohol dehydrogenase family) n=1 Tax=Allocatelliglobosispora scoriae TaxID=643052 RepID=A0A841BM64_9ACTN|nr:SDR family NAD(P)-dependent oxidoreductase [Allocatelliglobosispora scoriae]MBB5868448.1 NAD(P)-dependent dehydrogenase (short-subunit alcohol dehydrogenase family) [Allocatelliglobosispora scoriae]